MGCQESPGKLLGLLAAAQPPKTEVQASIDCLLCSREGSPRSCVCLVGRHLLEVEQDSITKVFGRGEIGITSATFGTFPFYLNEARHAIRCRSQLTNVIDATEPAILIFEHWK